MDLSDLVKHLSLETHTCLNLAVNLAVDFNYQEVSVEHMLIAINECYPQLITLVADLDLWLTPTIMNHIIKKSRPLETNSDAAPVLSLLLMDWLEVSKTFAYESWGEDYFCPKALLYVLVSQPCFSDHLHDGTVLPPTNNKLLDLERHLKKMYLLAPNTLGTGLPSQQNNSTVLEKFTHNLTRAAEEGRLDPVPERENEIRKIIDILLRRRQNNPLLAGEPGVGKTALMEGLAQRIVTGHVPDFLLNTEVLTLDLGLLQAGASVKGVFEQRIQTVISAIKSYPKPVILFIDEAHMLIGAGAGQFDAANLLKPELARGELRIVAATTWAEHKRHFEKDAALARRFEVIRIKEPSIEAATMMLRTLAPSLETHHQVTILDEAVTDTVLLSSRYITGRQFPDKAINLLDTACARVKVSQHCKPAKIELLCSAIARNKSEQTALLKECSDSERIIKLQKQLIDLQIQLKQHKQSYEQQRQLVQAIHNEKDHTSRQKIRRELKQLHQIHPFVFDCVDSTCIADVVSDWTGIPLGKMLEDETDILCNLETRLASRIYGQDHALKLIAEKIRIAKSQLSDPAKPIGVFLLTGPSGVGKTETALSLATEIYGGEHNLITVNMSEYQEAHSISSLKGSPPGYVGYGEGGVLTEAVRRQPYSVILLDEVDKAHSDVRELFYQVFDKGEMEDAEGNKINFRNCLFLLTTNLATDVIMQHFFNNNPHTLQTLEENVISVLESFFSSAFVGRTQVIPYFPINHSMLRDIILRKLGVIAERYSKVTGFTLYYSDDVVGYIAKRCRCDERGAREIDNVITTNILSLLSSRLTMKYRAETGNLKIGLINNILDVL